MLLKNAALFYQNSFQKINLLIKDGKINFVKDSFSCENSKDCSGCYIIPGLVDIHTHGCLGLDFADADASENEKMCRYYARSGVTSIIKTIMSAPPENMLRALSVPLPENGAHIQGLRLEGPFLNPVKRGAHKQELLKPHLMPALPLQPQNVFSFPILLSSAGFVFIHILHCLNRSYCLFLYALL